MVEVCFIYAANPAASAVPPMQVANSARISLIFLPENHGRNIAFKVLRKLPYGLIDEESFFRAHQNIFDLVRASS